MTDLTREQAREQVARIIAAQRYHYGSVAYDRDADAALTVLWPVVEGLRAERDEARGQRDATMIAAAENAPTAQTSRHLLGQLEACARELNGAFDLLAKVEDEVARLTAELAHAHTVIARHVEPKRSTGSWDQRLPDCGPAAAPVGDQGSGRVDMRGKEDHG